MIANKNDTSSYIVLACIGKYKFNVMTLSVT